MKDRIKKIAPWVGLGLVATLGAGMAYKAFFGEQSGSASAPKPTPTPFTEANSLDAVAGGSESNTVPTETPVSVVVSTEPILDSHGLPLKSSESCRIVAESGEIFYISVGKPTMIYGYRCLGRDANGINWWLDSNSTEILQTTN